MREGGVQPQRLPRIALRFFRATPTRDARDKRGHDDVGGSAPYSAGLASGAAAADGDAGAAPVAFFSTIRTE